jgi:hypothetical protein
VMATSEQGDGRPAEGPPEPGSGAGFGPSSWQGV